MKNQNNKRGFTLIETVIYIALFAVLMLAGFTTAYSLIQDTSSLDSKNVINSEIDFVLRKIDFALTGVEVINTPSSGKSSTLSVTKYNGENYQISLNNKKIEFNSIPITTDNIEVSNLEFQYIAGNPSGVKTTLTINGISATSTKFIR